MVRAPWSEKAVIYELNTRQFSAKGNFAGVQPRLGDLKKLGVDIVWFMPIHPIGVKNRKGPLGSPYAVKDFTGVNPEFGDLAQFKKTVAAAHAAGLHVIIDLVANHTAWDHPWTRQHPDWYVKNAKGEFTPPVADWTDVIKLDYSRPALREEMIRAMEFWVREVGVDGFRCDVAGEVPTDFWEQARVRLEAIRPVFMLAEATMAVSISTCLIKSLTNKPGRTRFTPRSPKIGRATRWVPAE
jgi:cyclomaltodextrinase / maltogenic alpha-amylase / neopullulanase